MLADRAFERDRKRGTREQRRKNRAERKPVPVTINGVQVIPKTPDPEPPKVPAHLRELPEVEPLPSWDVLRGAVRYRRRRALVHLRRSPRYARRIASWWWRGISRVADAWWHWARQPEHRALATRAAVDGDHKKHAGHLSDARWAGVWAATCLVGGASCALGVWRITGPNGVVAANLIVGALLVVIGKRPEEQLVTVDDQTPDEKGPVTVDLIAAAFEQADLRGVRTIGGVTHGGRRPYTHSQVAVALDGKVIEDAVRVLPRIAAGIGVSRGQVFIDAVPGQAEGRVTVTIADRDPMAGDPPRHPLSRADHHDLWNCPAPLGVDPRGQPRGVPLLWGHLLIGGQQRVGKTLAIADLLVAPVLDVAWDVDLLEFKGDQFFAPLRPLAGTYISAAEDRSTERTLTYLEELEDTVLARNRLLGQLPVDRCPLGKLTEELARTDRRFRPRVVVLDEFQNVIEDDGGGKVLEVTTRIARTAPSQAVSLILGMQRAPRREIGDLRSFLTIRFGMSMQEGDDSKMVLGHDHVNGVVDASMIPRERAGVGWLVGAGPTTLVRVCDWDRRQLEQLAARALPRRQDAGALPPPTSGSRPLTLVKGDQGLPSHVAAVFELDEEWLASAEIAHRLGDEWNARRVGRELRDAGVTVEERSWRDDGGTHTVAGVWRRDLP